ncbi:MAG: response regulator [Myxococcaceae bacterium]
MPRVLVLDDSATLLELTVAALTKAGLDAVGASDLASLNQALATGAFDAILVDVQMPEMFGDDVVEFLRREKKVAGRLLLYSDAPPEALAARAKSVGADGAVSKSAGTEAMVQTVLAQVGAAPTSGAQSARKPRVLIVDDSETTALLLQAELTEKGFEVFTADTADKATKIILKKKTRPDLVLLDVRMPNVDGEQFCRFIKGNSLFQGIKVLLCSAAEVEELKRICREAGADGYVAKDAVLSKVLSGAFS